MGIITSKKERDIEVKDPSPRKKKGKKNKSGQPGIQKQSGKPGRESGKPTQSGQTGTTHSEQPTQSGELGKPTTSGQRWMLTKSGSLDTSTQSKQLGSPDISSPSRQTGTPPQSRSPNISTRSRQTGTPTESESSDISTPSRQTGTPTESESSDISIPSRQTGTLSESESPVISTRSRQTGTPPQTGSPDISTRSRQTGTPTESGSPDILTRSRQTGKPTKSEQPWIPTLSGQSRESELPFQSGKPGIPTLTEQNGIVSEDDQSHLSGYKRASNNHECVEYAKPSHNKEGIESIDGGDTESSAMIKDEEEKGLPDEDVQMLTNVKVIEVQVYDPNKNFQGFGNLCNSPGPMEASEGDGCSVTNSFKEDDVSDSPYSLFKNSEIPNEIGTEFIDRGVPPRNTDHNENNLVLDDAAPEKKDTSPRPVSSCSDEDDLSDIECITAENVPSKKFDIANEKKDYIRDEGNGEFSSDENQRESDDLKQTQGLTFTVLDGNGNSGTRLVCIPTLADTEDQIRPCEEADDKTFGLSSKHSGKSVCGDIDADDEEGDYDYQEDQSNCLTTKDRNGLENTLQQKQKTGQGATSTADELTMREDPAVHSEGQGFSKLTEETNNRQVIFHVDLEKMEYIFKSKYQDKFNTFLENEVIIFDWKKGAKLAYVEFCGDENESTEALVSFLEEIQKSDIEIEEAFWKSVKAELATICSSFGDNPPLVKPLENEMKLRIVSCKSDIGYHIKYIRNGVANVIKEAAHDCKTFPVPSGLDPKNFFLLLEKINFKGKHLGEGCKDVKIRFDDCKGEIEVKGPKSQVEFAMSRFQEQECTTTEVPLKLPQRSLEFLMTKMGQEAIEKTLENYKIEAIVLFDHSSPSKPLSAKVLGYAKEAIIHIKEIAVEKEVYVERTDRRLTETPEWIELCNECKTKSGVLIREDQSGSVWITGIKDYVEQAACRLQEFLDKNSIENGEYRCASRVILEYITKYRKEELHLIESSLEQFDVHFAKSEGQIFHFSGRRKGLQLAKNKLNELIYSLVSRSIHESGPGVRKYFKEEGKGERWIKTLENDYECLIQVERKVQQKENTSYYITSQGHKVSWKIGDIVKERVDAVVSPQGVCTDSILHFSLVKKPPLLTALKYGEICVSSDFNLPCRYVLLTSCSNWNGGKGEQCLRKVVQRSLQTTDQLQGKSVAFPAIGTGMLQFPPAESARIMLDETLKFCHENPTSSVKDVCFLLLQNNSVAIDAFTQEMSHCQKMHRQISLPQTGKETWPKNIEIVEGDLTTEFTTEAIVNVLANDMNTTRFGSLCATVFRAAGSGVEEEFRNLLQTCERPKASITSGGKLQVPYIIHLIPSSSSDIKECLQQGLYLAKQRNIRSLSLPAVGTGGYGLSASSSATIIFEALSNVWFSNVRIVILQSNFKHVFETEKQKNLAPLTISKECKRDTNIKQVNIEVIHGDLTDEESDAIVNIINSDMEMENAGELSKAIAQVCGSNVKQECRKQAPQKGGSVVITSGGDLKVRHIIHFVPESSDVKHLQACVEKCLQLADSRGLHSVSLPAIGTGGYGMSAVISANLIFQALSSFCRTCSQVQNVRIVIKQMPMVEAFHQEKKRHAETSPVVVSTELKNQTVRVTFLGKNEECVNGAINGLKRDLNENCKVEEIKDEGVEKLSKSQLSMLIEGAGSCDVEMTVDAALGDVTLRGSKDEVHDMTKKINQEILKARETERKKQEHENARMISKTIQWFYELQGMKKPFDFKSNLSIEKAYSKGNSSVEVCSQGVTLVIDVLKNSGFTKQQNQQVAVTRKLKETEGICLPEYWAKMPSDDKDVHTFLLDINLPEYGDVSQRFYSTAEGCTITSIERIQNTLLFKAYMLKKINMDKVNGGNSEHKLFHGTSKDSVKKINQQGFNRSFCGKHGTRFGKGVYFARDARLSLNYTNPTDALRYMYLVKVLVGQYCLGDAEMKAPPAKDPLRPEILYDSTVDKTVNPEQFVVYHDNQCYPEYLITFQKA